MLHSITGRTDNPHIVSMFLISASDSVLDPQTLRLFLQGQDYMEGDPVDE